MRARCYSCGQVKDESEIILTNNVYMNRSLIAICGRCYYTKGFDKEDTK